MTRRHHNRTATSSSTKETPKMTALTRFSGFFLIPLAATGSNPDAPSAGPANACPSSARTQRCAGPGASSGRARLGSVAQRAKRAAFVKAAAGAMAVLAGVFIVAAPAQAASPALRVSMTPYPTNFASNSVNTGNSASPVPLYNVTVLNVGSAPTSVPFTATVTLPPGITEHGTGAKTVTLTHDDFSFPGVATKGGIAQDLLPGENVPAWVPVDVGALFEGSTATAEVAVAAGGAPPAHASAPTTISSDPAPFGFTSGRGGLDGALTDANGSPVTEAGARPYQLTLDLSLNSRITPNNNNSDQAIGPDGGVRDLRLALPRGLVLDPAATPVRCTEVQLESPTLNSGGQVDSPSSCPDASAVGVVGVTTDPLGGALPYPVQSPLYNMVPPAGVAAEFAFDAAAAGVFLHILGGVRPGDYALASDTPDILARPGQAVLGAQVELWGDPSDPTHDTKRGRCVNLNGGDRGHSSGPGGGPVTCPVAATDHPFITMPTACASSLPFDASADSWQNPGAFHDRSAQLTDDAGEPIGVSGCNGLQFNPTLQARPTTNVADSPSGLSVDLHVPQSNSLSSRATAHLRKAVVTLPPGLVLNPSSANGLAGCSSAQIGIDPDTGVANGNQPTCPDAAKIGDVEVDTPLLPNALPGSVYVATPFDNPFDSLLAIYIVVDDPQTGVLVKLAGHVVPDPNTGQLVTTFDNSPQLPFSDFKLDFFGGAGGVLRTPSVCGGYSTTSQLTPWSAPESGPPATPHDDYAITGNCSSSAASQPNKPEFEAGTVSPIAGKYTPFNVHLKREDGSQQFKTLTLSPPPGLTAKLAGTPACSDGALASAASKSGHDEQANPSCPSASQIGTVSVGAGAGPAPYYAKAKAYLAGPYKGAPLSMAIITPAVAGPFDLGTVVTRVALHVDPATAQITADADPIPSILQGIPLDVRSVDVSLDKPGFSRTGTSCDPFSVDGQLVSTLGQSAALQSRYQLGNCVNLAFKPKLGIRLKGGTKRGKNPALIATLSAKDGEANIASTAVTLPRSAFLDQSHIRTVCTRVQFAAGAGNGAECPAGSIYGTASAKSPLLDYSLTGNAYLRSSSHKLPDLVIALKGPSSQPIAIELVGRTDSVKGALRNTFEAVPDAPVSSFRLELFGGKRGLVVNSRNICARTYRASVVFGAQNGAALSTSPKVRAQCPKSAHKRHKRHSHSAR